MSDQATSHVSVLTAEVLQALAPASGRTYLDGTFGGGGHSRAILEASAPEGKVVGLDRDESVERFASKLETEFGSRFRFLPIAYEEVVATKMTFDGAVLDLGLSSDQLDPPAGGRGRGFSFQRPGDPLDLRFNDNAGQTAAQFLNQSSAARIEQVFRDYAEDRYAKRLAVKIVNGRRAEPIRTVSDFVGYVGSDNPKVLAPLFQALRIEVNDELGSLKRGLANIQTVLKAGGRLAVISFHSLEDRIVKEFFRSGDWEIITRKPVGPSEQEILQNPRSRSAKLRVGTRR